MKPIHKISILAVLVVFFSVFFTFVGMHNYGRSNTLFYVFVNVKSATLEIIRYSKEEIREVLQAFSDYSDEPFRYMWKPIDHRQNITKGGVVKTNPALVSPGYTVIIGKLPEAIIVDHNGNEIHKWSYDYQDLWPEAIQRFNNKAYWHDVWVYPNGDLLVLSHGLFRFGKIGIFKLDKDSNLLWKYDSYTHHDFDVAENGDIYVISKSFRKKPLRIIDEIVILSPDGKEKDIIKIIDKFNESSYKHLLPLMDIERDFTHLNNVDILDKEMAEYFPMFEAGDLLISPRNYNLIAVLDHETHQPKWISIGQFKSAHDPDFNIDGTISLFDNQGGEEEYGASRIIKIDPLTDKIVWSYDGGEDNYFFTPFRGDHIQLENGNILVSETESGKVFEITQKGELVWKYVSPWMDIKRKRIAVVNAPFRITEKEYPFLKEILNTNDK